MQGGSALLPPCILLHSFSRLQMEFLVNRVPLLANDFTVVYESPDPAGVYCYTPSVLPLPDGRLVATCDLGGPGVAALNPAVRIEHPRNKNGFMFVGKVFTSDDHGATWDYRADFPAMHARPFLVGDSIYILGKSHDLTILRSDDRGETWTDAVKLTEGEIWHQSACNVHYANGNVYLVMERQVDLSAPGWPVNALAPVLMRASLDSDLLKRESWTFASELTFRDVYPENGIDLMGIPFFTPGEPKQMSIPGWLETNVVQFTDPDHVWHDPTGHTFHLWARAHTGGTNYAAIAKVVEHDDGTMTTEIERVPSGQRVLLIPCPGGEMRFHVLHDEESGLYWLLTTMPFDSMTRMDRLPADRYNLPNNERHVLGLYFSKNMVDWWPAGVVARGETAREARHYAGMAFDGDDIVVLSRSGDSRAKNAHDGNLITFHRVKNYRDLVY